MKYLVLIFLLLVGCQKAPAESPSETTGTLPTPVETSVESQRPEIKEIFQKIFQGESIQEDLVEKADVEDVIKLSKTLALSGMVDVKVLKEEADHQELEVILTDYRLLVQVDYEKNKIRAMKAEVKPLLVEPQESDQWKERAVKVGEPQMAAMLTIPKAGENWPLVFIISGSGSSGMDGSIGKAGNALYRDMAHALAEKGIATLRYNDRYYEFPELAQKKITIYEEVLDDADWIAKHAKEWEGFEKSPLFVMGHSLGGMLTPSMLERNPDLAGGISLAGTPRYLEDIIYMQNEDAVNAQNLDEAAKKVAMAQVSVMVKAVKEIKGPDEASNPMGIPASYWYSLTQESAPNRKNFTQPMLILQGGMDFQVKASVDFELWKEYFSDRSDISYELFAGLNHLFMPSQGIASLEDYNKKATLDPAVVDAVEAWINKVKP